ncbi:MAG TPA: hypothetical protein VEB63_05010 [Chitinophagaceae bacterium]|nr:hypothetical protein [Chitinophagaceae bacterium]
MKRLLLVAVLSCLVRTLPAQQDSQAAAYYYKKSKTQRGVGIALLASGAAAFTVGAAIWMNGFADGLDFSNPGAESVGMDTGEVVMILGAVTAGSGVPFLISAGVNRKKAMRLSGELRSVRVSPDKRVTIPSLTLKLDL